MSSIRFDEFARILGELNPRIRLFPSRSKRSSMIYIRNSYHPESGKYGLGEVCAYPSPLHGSFPKFDFLDKSNLPARGYTSVFKMLVRKRLINKDRLRALLPQALDAACGRPQRKAETDAPPPIPVHYGDPGNTGRRVYSS